MNDTFFSPSSRRKSPATLAGTLPTSLPRQCLTFKSMKRLCFGFFGHTIFSRSPLSTDIGNITLMQSGSMLGIPSNRSTTNDISSCEDIFVLWIPVTVDLMTMAAMVVILYLLSHSCVCVCMIFCHYKEAHHTYWTDQSTNHFTKVNEIG